jgi:translation initiation factor IF-2
MSRMRVHELAKELNMSNKDLIERIARMGVPDPIKNHMSALTESTVQKVRQQFAEAKAEKVEEKRIGRAVIRRRKRVTEEELGIPSAAVGEGEEIPAAVKMEWVPPSVTTLEAPVPQESEALDVAAAAPIVAVQPEREEGIKPEASLGVAPSSEPAPVEPSPVILPPVDRIAAAAEEQRLPADQPVPMVEVTGEHLGRAEREVLTSRIEEEPLVALAPKLTAMALPQEVETSPEPVPAISEEGMEEEEGADKAKPKKAKKRRRKKVRKDEPARIISLPEIIPEEEVEEEPEPIPIITRLQVKAEEPDIKELARKRKPKAEEFERETADRKRRWVGRKEVLEREDLYSKKELAAQADRGRLKDKEKFPSIREVLKPEPAAPKPGKRRIKIDEAITVANLARQMGVKAAEVLKKLLLLGLPANINQAMDFDTAALLASEFDFDVEKVGFEEEEILQIQQDRLEDLVHRPPVVTVMGHVDHGKTSLLDAIRHTKVIEGEAGGITQHIGAHYVRLKSGDVVFLDTPGHEAFTSMRARGAKVTDIVILVVAADDGVMQQTIEAINHSKAAKVPIVVAINKIDKPNANIDRVKRELAENGLIPEEWGGDVAMVGISAKERIGIDELMEMVLLQAEIMELRASANKPARGRVIEAKLDKGRGPVATILIQEGTLKTGDVYVCGVHSGRVRNIFDDVGQKLDEAGPSMPVEVLGLSGVPNAGDDFVVITDDKQAKMVAEHRLVKLREKELSRTTKVSLENLYDQIREGEVKELPIILKTDVHGSQEAISDSILKLSTNEVKINLIHNATGAVTETDVMLASASKAIIIGFNVRGDAKVLELAEQEHVDVRYYDIIYQLLSDVKDAMVGMLEPVYQESVLGRAEVRQTFHVPRIGIVAGCYVLDGRVERGARARVLRDQVVVYDGKIGSLRRFKDDAKEVKAGFECGIGIENFNDIKVGDILEAYELKEVKPALEHEGDRK